MKKTAGWIVIALVIVGVPLLTGELLIRLFFPQPEAMRWFQSDPRYGYRLKKNFRQSLPFIGFDFVMNVQTNDFGHRDPPYDPAKLQDPGVKKILLIGDSFTFGHGINREHHFGTQLQALLDRSGTRALVINSGVGGWGTLQATRYATDHLQRFNPGVIIYTFCGNDPRDDSNFRHKKKDNEKGLLYFPGKIFLRNHSHLYRFSVSSVHIIAHNWMLKREMTAVPGQDLKIDQQSGEVISEAQWQETLRRIVAFHQTFQAFNPNGLFLVQASAPWVETIRSRLATLSNHQNLVYVDLFKASAPLPPQQRHLPQ